MIGTATLSDVEFEGLSISDYGYDQETYDALLGVLDSRELISSTKDRLLAYFKAHGADIAPPLQTGNSNIYLGGAL